MPYMLLSTQHNYLTAVAVERGYIEPLLSLTIVGSAFHGFFFLCNPVVSDSSFLLLLSSIPLLSRNPRIQAILVAAALR